MIDEGYIKFRSEWTRTEALDHREIGELIRWRRPLYAAGLIGHYADVDIGYGNISMRRGDSAQFLVSGTQTGHLGELWPEHFSLVTGYDIERNTVRCTGAAEASSESMTHAAIYELDPRIYAVVHVHSEELWVRLKGRLPTTEEGIDYGTPQMAKEFYRLHRESGFREVGVAVMAGHDSGLISIGHDMQQASERILWLARDFAT